MPKFTQHKSRAVIYDGIKATDLWNGDRGWDILSGPSSNNKQDENYYFRNVPWLYRGVKDRAHSVSKVPFAIVNGEGVELDTSGQWEDTLNFMPLPRNLIQRIEQSIAMAGRAYVFMETNSFQYVKKLVYCTPTSISEHYDPQTGELDYYIRRVRGQERPVPCENIIAIYDPDYDTEQGPAQSSDAKAALNAAGVLFNADQFISQYFSRGAIRATILSVDTADQREAQRLQAWWEDVVAGIRNAWSALVVRSKTATPTVIGSGLEGLQNSELTKEKRQDISTALGVPESRMWSSAANYSTAEVEDSKYFSDLIVPECWLIQDAFNSCLFTEVHHMAGYRFEFRPEATEKYNKEEAFRAQAFDLYAKTLKPSVAAQLVGLQLPAGMTYEMLDGQPVISQVQTALETAKPSQTLPILESGPMYQEANTTAMMSLDALRELDWWQRKALKMAREGKPMTFEFRTEALPQQIRAVIVEELGDCTSAEGVKKLFGRFSGSAKPADPMALLAAELKRANDLLEAHV